MLKRRPKSYPTKSENVTEQRPISVLFVLTFIFLYGHLNIKILFEDTFLHSMSQLCWVSYYLAYFKICFRKESYCLCSNFLDFFNITQKIILFKMQVKRNTNRENSFVLSLQHFLSLRKDNHKKFPSWQFLRLMMCHC